jgi:carboxymethylenebutenolidase
MSADTPLSIHAPSGTTKGAVVVIQEAFGVNDHIEDMCARLAAEGWFAIAPHFFHRTGDPKLGYDDFSKVAPHFSAVNKETIDADLDAGLLHAAEAGFAPSAIGIVGWCFGGTVTLYATATREIGAGVTYYGGGVATARFGLPSGIESAPHLRAPWLGLYGDLDTGIPVDDVEQLRVAAATASVPTEIVRYPQAEHGFNCDVRSSYNAEAAADAWKRTLAHFDANLKHG